MPYKKELVIIGFLIGLVVIVAVSILSTKKFMFRDFSITAPTTTDSFFDNGTLAEAKNIYITTFNANGNIEPMSLEDVLFKVQMSQRFLMDKVNELVDAKLAAYIRRGDRLSIKFERTWKSFKMKDDYWVIADAAGDGEIVQLHTPIYS